ncbi:MAG: CDP-alcohol phosphatidyltransferase family protein [Anaerotruncus sp.]|nr:CDP-alcohol phosphatidyltransferase family protein [Anaerotruncus sp.]
MGTLGRRPIKSRGTFWAKAMAELLVKAGVSPNAISIMSVLFALIGMCCLLAARYFSSWLLLVGAAACILLRLLCNLLDGMVAVEGGRHSALGDLFNELPDRFSDLVLIVPLGYLCHESYGPVLGWFAGVLALATAYLRAFSAVQGCISFVGPMAKSHRMALEVAGLLLAVLLGNWISRSLIFYLVLVLMILGCCVTLLRRGHKLVVHMRGGNGHG